MTNTTTRGPLAGIRILELSGIGPGPFAGMLLADMGADVIVVERPAGVGAPSLGHNAILNRGKRSICIDLKAPRGADLILRLLENCDALIEGMRPGVMERLGLGPETCFARRPELVYGRMTGWGQSGPLAQSAGHDINYIALSGALWYSGEPGTVPVAPPTLVGDLGGGALYLAMGILAALLQVRAGGRGQVIDAAVLDGSANLMNLLLSFHGSGAMPVERGLGLLDGYFCYGAYRCADDRFVAIGALEPQFFAEFLQRLGLGDDEAFAHPEDKSTWPRARARLQQLFSTAHQSSWCELLEGTDACFAPVLDPREAAIHPHLVARNVYRECDGVLQTAPAPRFSGFPGANVGPIPLPGEDWKVILADVGMTDAQAQAWVDCGVVSAVA